MQPDGVYEPVVKLGRSHRTIVLPSPIALDTKPPTVTVSTRSTRCSRPTATAGATASASPTGSASRRTRSSPSAAGGCSSPRAEDDRRARLGRQGQELAGSARQAKPGRYLLTISAQDRAANVSKGFPFAIAQVRYVALARKRVVVRPGGKFALRVSTDAPRVTGGCTAAPASSGRGRCTSARRSRPASSSSTSSRPATPRGPRWSSHERRRRADRRRGRGGRARAAARRDAAGPAARRARRLGGRLRDARALPRAGGAPPGARGGRGARRGLRGGRRLGRPARAVAARARDARVRAGALPRHVGSTEANLLLPLYAVVAVAALALAWQLFGEEQRARELGPLAWPLALFVGWDGALAPLDEGRAAGGDRAALLRPAVRPARGRARAAPWSRAWVLALYVQLALMALVFAVVGIVQYVSRDIFWNPKVRVDNAYAPSGWFYRVNSVFYDPSIYGRFLVLGILASLVVVLRRRGDPLWAVAAALTIAITWVGLLPSFSQSSFVALAAAATLCAVLVWRWRSRALVARRRGRARFAGVASPQIRHRIEGKSSSSLVERDERPLDARLERAQVAVAAPASSASASVVSSTPTPDLHAPARARSRRRRRRTRRRSPSPPRPACPGSAALRAGRRARSSLAFRRLAAAASTATRALAFGLALSAILVHCLFYNALFEDPMFWGLLALDRASRRARAPAEEPVRVIERLAARARARAAHRRRRVRLRRHDGPARRERRRRSLRRVLDRDPLAAGGLRARHARARGARGDGRARHPGRSNLTVHDFDVRTFPEHRQEILELLIEIWNDWQPDCVFHAVAARRPPGPPDDRAGGPARVQAHDDPRLRDPLEQLRLRLPGLLRARSRRTSSARSRRSRSTPRSSTAATRTPSTSGTSRARTAST